MTVGEKLRDWIERHGLSQGEFADKIGSTQSYVSRLISGEREPGRRIAHEIERETRAEIRAEHWDEAKPRRRVRRLVTTQA